MSELRATGKVGLASSTTVGAPGALAQVVNPPPRLGELSVGQNVPGVVTGVDRDGRLLVRTDYGLLALRTLQRPAVGSAVTLHVRHIAGAVTVHLVMTAHQHDDPGQSHAAPARSDATHLGTQLQARMEAPAGPTDKEPALVPRAGSSLTLRIVGLELPGTGLQPVGDPSRAGTSTLRGQVVGVGGDGRLLVQTTIGLVSLSSDLNFKVGTRLTLSVEPSTTPASLPSHPSPWHPKAIGWPNAEALAALLVRAGFEAPLLPLRPGSDLAARLLLFLLGVTHGDARLWLPMPIRQYLEGRTDGRRLISRLSDDLRRMAQFAERDEDGWRCIPLPTSGQDVQGSAWLRMRQGRPSGQQDYTPLHFLVDLELRRLGWVQLEGLVRGPCLDLQLRSQRPVAAGLKHDLTALFEEALAIGGYKGQLTFPAARTWQRPLPPQVRPSGLSA